MKTTYEMGHNGKPPPKYDKANCPKCHKLVAVWSNGFTHRHKCNGKITPGVKVNA